MAKSSKSNRIHRRYLSLLKKYGAPSGFWEKWCKDKKTKKDREEIVVGAILTQRTNWRNVELALKNLKREKILSIKKIKQTAENDITAVEGLIRPAGFYRQKAERLFLLCRYLNDVHGSLKNFFSQDVVDCREQLLEQKGVGPETADSILLYAGDKPIFVVDEYTRRFVKKNGLAGDFSYEQLQKFFQKNLPKNFKLYQDYHALIVLEGKINSV